MISHGVDYIFISSRAVAPACIASLGRDESRRIASAETEAFPFGSVVTGSCIFANADFPRYCRVVKNSQNHGRVHRYKPTCWYGIAAAAPRRVKVPNLPAAVNAQGR